MAQSIASTLNKLANNIMLPDIAGVPSFIADYFGSACDFSADDYSGITTSADKRQSV